jgi:hypothetical protein
VAGRPVGDSRLGAVGTVQPVRIESGVGRTEVGHTEVVGRTHVGSGRSDKVCRPVEGGIPDLVGYMEDILLDPGRNIHLQT